MVFFICVCSSGSLVLLDLAGIVNVGQVDELVEHGWGETTKGRSYQIDPKEAHVGGSFLALSWDVDDLVDCLDETESGVEAATWDGPGGVDHCKKCEGNGGGLKDTVLALLSAVVDLANDALAEEESAPELQEEDLTEPVKVNAAVALIIGAEESWLSETEMSVESSEESTNNLWNDNHADEHSLLENLTFSSVDGESHSRVEHATGHLGGHQDTHEEVETDC